MDKNDNNKLDKSAVSTYPEGFGIDARLPWEFEAAKREFYKSYLTALLTKAQGNVARAAKMSGIRRTNFYRMLKRVGYSRKHFYKYSQPETPENRPDPHNSIGGHGEDSIGVHFHMTIQTNSVREAEVTYNNERPVNTEHKLRLSAYIDGNRVETELPWNLRTARREIRRTYLLAALEACGGTVSEAAKLIGVNRTNFYRMLKKAGHSLHTAVDKTEGIAMLPEYRGQVNKH